MRVCAFIGLVLVSRRFGRREWRRGWREGVGGFFFCDEGVSKHNTSSVQHLMVGSVVLTARQGEVR